MCSLISRCCVPSVALLMSVFASLHTGNARAQSDPTIESVQAAHAAARRSIRTLSAVVKVELIKPEPKLLGAGKYWRVGDQVRVHEEGLAGSMIDYPVMGGELRRIITPGQAGARPPAHAARMTEVDYVTRTNAFEEMLNVLASPDGKPIDLDALSNRAASGVAVKRERHDGENFVVLSLSVASSRGPLTDYKIMHSIAKNYLIQWVEAVPDQNPDNKFVSEVTKWLEPVPGVFLPSEVVSTAYKKRDVIQSRVSTLSDVVVNQPIVAGMMALPRLPQGSFLKDDIAGVSGLVDSNWKPIGTMTPTPKLYPAPPQRSTTDTTEFAAQTASEPRSAGFWILISSCGLLIILIVLTVIHRARSDRE